MDTPQYRCVGDKCAAGFLEPLPGEFFAVTLQNVATPCVAFSMVGIVENGAESRGHRMGCEGACDRSPGWERKAGGTACRIGRSPGGDVRRYGIREAGNGLDGQGNRIPISRRHQRRRLQHQDLRLATAAASVALAASSLTAAPCCHHPEGSRPRFAAAAGAQQHRAQCC